MRVFSFLDFAPLSYFIEDALSRQRPPNVAAPVPSSRDHSQQHLIFKALANRYAPKASSSCLRWRVRFAFLFLRRGRAIVYRCRNQLNYGVENTRHESALAFARGYTPESK